MQFSNSICTIWCIPSANNLLKIQYSFPMKIFAIVMSIPPTFPLLFNDKILAISRLFLPPFLFWYLCQSYYKSLANEEKKMGCLKKLKKIAIFKLNFRNLVHTFANILLKIHYSFPIKYCLCSCLFLCLFLQRSLYCFMIKYGYITSIPPAFPVLIPLPELL